MQFKSNILFKISKPICMDGIQVNYTYIDSLRQLGGLNLGQLEPLEHQILAKGAPSVYCIVI